MLLMLACADLGCGQRLGRCLDLEALVILAPICREERVLCRLGASTAGKREYCVDSGLALHA